MASERSDVQLAIIGNVFVACALVCIIPVWNRRRDRALSEARRRCRRFSRAAAAVAAAVLAVWLWLAYLRAFNGRNPLVWFVCYVWNQPGIFDLAAYW
jgi:multisubunit Na+/H+ antiporter MnhB subunit